MRENLFGTEEPAAPVADTPETPAEEPAAVPDGKIAALETSVAETNQAVQNLAGRLESIFAQAAAQAEANNQPAQEPVAIDNDQFLNELANDPSGTIDRRAQAVIAKMADEQLTPTLTTILETTHDTLLTKHEMEIDKEFGENTWSEIIQPAMEKDMANLRNVNYRAIADPGSIKALVDRQLGLNFKTLRERATTKEKADQEVKEAQVSQGLPQGGQPRIRMANSEPDEDAKLFFSEIEAATGDKIDTKTFMKLHNAGNTIDDYLAVVGGDK
jgi:hypothetical protein